MNNVQKTTKNDPKGLFHWPNLGLQAFLIYLLLSQHTVFLTKKITKICSTFFYENAVKLVFWNFFEIAQNLSKHPYNWFGVE